jgi:hypothetical protein
MTKGFLIIAHGDPVYFKFAANLIASIKIQGTYHVTLVTDRDGRNKVLAPGPDEIIEVSRPVPFYIKTLIGKLSPYDHTIFLDVDSYCLNDPGPLFDQEPDLEMHVVDTYGHERIKDCGMEWADLKKMWEFYAWDFALEYPETNSSYIRWRKTPETDRFFDLAERLYAEWPYTDYKKSAFPFYPDELAWNAALTFMKIKLSKTRPIYIHYHNRGPINPSLLKNSYFMTLPGAFTTHSHMWQYYHKRANRDMIKHFKRPGYKPDRRDKINHNFKRRDWSGMREFDMKSFMEVVNG